jgi:hypothetical protein
MFNGFVEISYGVGSSEDMKQHIGGLLDGTDGRRLRFHQC